LGLVGCGDGEGYKVYAPDGATALGLSYMMEFCPEIGGKKVDYNVVPTATIASYVQSERADFAVLPVNAAVSLYKLGAPYRLAAVLTHGNLFLVGPQEALGLGGWAGLEGKVVAVIGKGNIPQWVFERLLTHNGVSFVEGDKPTGGKAALTFAADGEAAILLLTMGKADFALIAEPSASNVINKFRDTLGLAELFDIQEQWGAAYPYAGAGYPQAALLVKNGIDSDFVEDFLTRLVLGNGWAAENPALAEAAAKVHAIAGTEVKLPVVTSEIVQRCNIFAKTDGLKEYIEAFYGVVSLAPPDERFYYYFGSK